MNAFVPIIQKGMGLGLAIVKELADSHSASIDLVSNKQGNTFKLNFPITLKINPLSKAQCKVLQHTPDEEIKDETSSLKNPNNCKQSLPTILLVEDNLELAQFLLSSLTPFFNVKHSVNGRDALFFLSESIVDLIVSDVMMPVMDGYEFCQQVKDDEALRHIPLFLLTAKSDLVSRKKGFQLKADDYIGKPFNTDILIQKVTNHIATKQALANSLRQQLLNGTR